MAVDMDHGQRFFPVAHLAVIWGRVDTYVV